MPALFPNGVRVNLPRGVARTNGLLNVIRPSRLSDPHWMVGGVNWEDYICGAVTETFVDFCPPTTGFTKTNERGIDYCHSDPFQVKAGVLCSTGGRPPSEWFEIARQRLLALESRAVEEAFWTGVTLNATIEPSLATGSEECEISINDLTGGTPVNIVDGISILEEALGDTFTTGGYIHASTRLPAYLSALLQINEEDGKLYSPGGHQYVIGAGYPGTGPENVAPATGTSWLFATGPLGIYESGMYVVPDEISQAVNRSINDIEVLAEKYYTVGLNCAIYAVNVNLTCSCE